MSVLSGAARIRHSDAHTHRSDQASSSEKVPFLCIASLSRLTHVRILTRLAGMCIATSFIAACSHLKIAPQAAEHTLRTGTRSPYAGTQTATHHGERLRCCQALQLTRSHPSGAARLYELSATSPFCCRVSFGSHIFRHVCPWHRAVPARFIANDLYLVKLFEPGGGPFLPSIFISVGNS